MKSIKQEFERQRDDFKKRLPSICFNCESTKELTIHHIVPIANGGTNNLTNLAVLCVDCHNKLHGTSVFFKELQQKGYQRARENGIKLGRPKTKITNKFKLVYYRWKAGEITTMAATKEAGLTKSTFYRLVKEYEERDS